MSFSSEQLPRMTAELFKAFEVLTGFAESQRDDGIAHAPTEHINDARAILRRTYATRFAMNPLNAGKHNPWKEIQ